MLSQFIRPGLLIFAASLPLWIMFRCSVRGRLALSSKRELYLFVFYAYATAVLLFTVVPIPMSLNGNPEYSKVNLLPFIKTINGVAAALEPAGSYLVPHYLKNILGNILLFVPVGVLVPVLSKKNASMKRVLGIAFISSVLIESLQYILSQLGSYRSVDIDDVILNSIGGIVGYGLFLLLTPRAPVTRASIPNS